MIGGFLPMRWVEYDYEEVPFSMDKYSIHGRNILSMDLIYPWVPCNIDNLAPLVTSPMHQSLPRCRNSTKSPPNRCTTHCPCAAHFLQPIQFNYITTFLNNSKLKRKGYQQVHICIQNNHVLLILIFFNVVCQVHT